MANSIITKYLSDTSIPEKKRRNIVDMLNSGKMTEAVAVNGITTKYSDKYGSPTTGDAGGMAGNLLKGAVSAANPKNWGDMAAGAVKATAPGITKGLIEGGRSMTPEQKASASEWLAEQEKKREYETGIDQKLTQALNNMGIAPPGEWTLEQKQEALVGVSEQMKPQAFKEMEMLTSLGKSVYGSTLEPVGQFNLGMAGSAVAGSKGAFAQISELLKSGDWEKAQAVADKAMAEPVMMGDDNINWFRGENDKLDRMASASNIATEGVRGGAGAINTASIVSPGLALNVPVQAAAGGGLAFGDAMREGKSPLDIAWDTGSSAIVQGGLSFLIGKIAGKPPKSSKESSEMLKDNMLKKGVKEQYSNMLSKINTTERKIAVDYLDAGLKKLDDFRADDVYKYATKESGLDDFIKQVDYLKVKLGKQVGSSKQALTNTTVSDDVLRGKMPQMDDIFLRYNIKKTSKGLNFNNSELASSTKAQEQISKIFKTLKTGKNISARDLEAVTGQIDQATGVLKASGIKTNDPPVKALTDLKKIINEVVSESDVTFGAANKRYAKFIKYYNQIKTAGKVKIDSGKEVFNGEQILKRSLTTGDKKYTEAINAMDSLAKKYDLTIPKDLKTRARLADIAETFTGTQQPRSFGGEIAEGAEAIPKIGKGIMAIRKIKEVITREVPKPLQKQTEQLQTILKESLQRAEKSGSGGIILPKNIGLALIGLTDLLTGKSDGGKIEG